MTSSSSKGRITFDSYKNKGSLGRGENILGGMSKFIMSKIMKFSSMNFLLHRIREEKVLFLN